jgi:hypothetical protein
MKDIIPEEYSLDDIFERSAHYKLKENNKMNKHSWAMLGGFAVVFLVGANSAFHGGFTPTNVIDMVIAGLLAVEHSFRGATN